MVSGISEKEYAEYFDSVNVCFSKGLGAPVGSALAGSAELIDRARRFRKQFGGGMRQAGIIAAGALFALKHNRARLAKDHKNAKELVRGIAGLPGIKIDEKTVETNIVLFGISSKPANQVAEQLYQSGVHVLATGPEAIRAVTNLDISSRQIKEAVSVFEKVLTT